MKTLYTLLFIFISFSVHSQVIENPGFEEWEYLGNGNPEPVQWSSTQSCLPENLATFAPQVLFIDSIDPYEGNYSLKLENVYVAIANVVSNGIGTNGRILADFNPDSGATFTDTTDSKWYTQISTRPDSIVGYYKYTPQGIDITTIQALLHNGPIGVIPPGDDSTGWVGMALFESPNETISEWTRFSAPFVYFNDEDPEYILFNLSAGDGVNAINGSVGYYDEIALVFNPVGLDENVANHLLSVYAADKTIVVDMRKFGAGEKFDLEVYNLSGQLILSDQMISGYTKEIKMENVGVYICRLQSKDGLTLSKKVVVQ